MMASLLAALMLACTPKEVDGPVGGDGTKKGGGDEGGGDEGGKDNTVPTGGNYGKDEQEPGHVDVEPGEGGDDNGYIEDIGKDIDGGGLDDMELDEDEMTWSLKVKPSALIPGAIPENYKAGEEYVNIPEDFINPPTVLPEHFTYELRSGAILLKMPREVGETILEQLLPEDFGMLFENEEGRNTLNKFTNGILKVTNTEVMLIYKYRMSADKMLLYIDKDMMSSTLGYILEIADVVAANSDIESTQEFEAIIEHIRGYKVFVDNSEKFEVGTNFSLNI